MSVIRGLIVGLIVCDRAVSGRCPACGKGFDPRTVPFCASCAPKARAFFRERVVPTVELFARGVHKNPAR